MSDADFVVMPADPLERVRLAMEDMKMGRMVILVDDEDRENEGDFVMAAEFCRPTDINFMAVEGRGLICLSLTGDQVSRLGLPMMASNNKSAYETAFTVSIEAREGVTTGISAADRARTIQVAISPDASPADIVVPGHMFPLKARDGGVLERVGQTEGSVDLARLAGLTPAAVICEMMKPDGTMARLPDLIEFGKKHKMHICTVADIIKYRMQTERIVERVDAGTIHIPGTGDWHSVLYRGVTTDDMHMAIFRGEIREDPTLVRVQVAPAPWALFVGDGSQPAASAKLALERIAQEGRGVVILMHLAGGSIRAIESAYARDVRGEADPVPQVQAEALRDLGTGCQILRDLGCRQLDLLTNSTRDFDVIEAYGLSVASKVPLTT